MFGFKKRPQVLVQTNCVKTCPKSNECPLWVTFTKTVQEDKKKKISTTGNCAIAWIPTLMVEIREAIDRGNKK